MLSKILLIASRKSTWILIAALANAGGLYVNPSAAAAIADVASAAARSLGEQDQCTVTPAK